MVSARPIAVVLVLLAVELILIFGHSVNQGFVADDFSILSRRTGELNKVFYSDGSIHYLPVQYAILFAVHKAFGANPFAFHVVALTLALSCALLTMVLGRCLTGRLSVGALAGALFLAWGSHYQPFIWTVPGVAYSSACALTLGGMLFYIRAHDMDLPSRARRIAYACFALAMLAAPFAYELGITLFGAAALYRFFIIDQGTLPSRATLAPRLRSWVRDFILPLGVVLLFFGVFAWRGSAAEKATVTTPLTDQLLSIATSLLRVGLPGMGPNDVKMLLSRAETVLPWPSQAVAGYPLSRVVLSTVVVVSVAAIIRFGPPVVRFLLSWIVLMVAAMTFGFGSIMSRHVFLIAAPVSILWASAIVGLGPALHAASVRLGFRLVRMPLLVWIPSLIVTLVLFLTGVRFAVAEQSLWADAAAEVNGIFTAVEREAAAHPSAAHLYLVDLPERRKSSSGETIFLLTAASVGLQVENRFRDRFDTIAVVHSGTESTKKGEVLSVEEFGAIAENPDNLLLRYDAKDGALSKWTPPHGPDPAELHPVTDGGRGAIDLVDGNRVKGKSATVGDHRPAIVSGWAVNASKTAPAGGIFVTVDGKPAVWATYGEDRPDVADRLGVPNLREVGFTAKIPADALAPGQHTLGLWVVAPDQRSYTDVPDLVEIVVRP